MTKTSAQTSRTVDLVQLINQLDIRRFHRSSPVSGGGIMEKSPALASPPALIFATQFAMTGKSFPVDSRLN